MRAPVRFTRNKVLDQQLHNPRHQRRTIQLLFFFCSSFSNVRSDLSMSAHFNVLISLSIPNNKEKNNKMHTCITRRSRVIYLHRWISSFNAFQSVFFRPYSIIQYSTGYFSSSTFNIYIQPLRPKSLFTWTEKTKAERKTTIFFTVDWHAPPRSGKDQHFFASN